MAISDGVLNSKSKNVVKTMAGFSKNPAILFAMFLQGSTSDPSGVDMAPMPVCVSDCDKNIAFFYKYVHYLPYE